MDEHGVEQLGYLGLEVTDPGAWEEFAIGVLGLEPAGPDLDGGRLLRLDDHHHRLSLHEGPSDDVAHVGWLVRDEAALRAVVGRLESSGHRCRPAGSDRARARGVAALVETRDPDGIPIEIAHGPRVRGDRPFRSPRSLSGFVAGELGLGHIALTVADAEASSRFYREILGLRLSDVIEMRTADGDPLTATFLHCGPRHHSIALVQDEAPTRLHHLMLEVATLADVGTTYDLCLDRGVPITATLGCHTNDGMTSFYMASPSGFGVEYGHGGRLIDPGWQVARHDTASIWGHRTP